MYRGCAMCGVFLFYSPSEDDICETSLDGDEYAQNEPKSLTNDGRTADTMKGGQVNRSLHPEEYTILHIGPCSEKSETTDFVFLSWYHVFAKSK